MRRNPVAKNAKVNRSAVMIDRKKAAKRGIYQDSPGFSVRFR